MRREYRVNVERGWRGQEWDRWLLMKAGIMELIEGVGGRGEDEWGGREDEVEKGWREGGRMTGRVGRGWWIGWGMWKAGVVGRMGEIGLMMRMGRECGRMEGGGEGWKMVDWGDGMDEG